MTHDIWLQVFLQNLYATFLHDSLRYIIGAGGTYLIINVALARWLKARKIQDRAPSKGQITRELLTSARTVLIFTASGTSIAMMEYAGIARIYFAVADYGLAYLILSTVLIVLAHDAYFYWSHRALHHPRVFRKWHMLHHKSHVPTPFTSYAFDWEEAVINAVFFVVWIVLIPMHPIALLSFLVHMMIRNTLGHCGYEVFPARKDGRPLIGWMTTVTHHDLHHSQGRWNMGFYFTWWDRWMGTEHPEYLQTFKRVKKRDISSRPAAGSTVEAPPISP